MSLLALKSTMAFIAAALLLCATAAGGDIDASYAPVLFLELAPQTGACHTPPRKLVAPIEPNDTPELDTT